MVHVFGVGLSRMVRDCGSPLGGFVGGARASEVTNRGERGVGGITRTEG
jgi:hypothetical protein